MDGEDEEVTHGVNRTIVASACKTAPQWRIRSYYDFATHRSQGVAERIDAGGCLKRHTFMCAVSTRNLLTLQRLNGSSGFPSGESPPSPGAWTAPYLFLGSFESRYLRTRARRFPLANTLGRLWATFGERFWLISRRLACTNAK